MAHILIVEDDPGIAEVISIICEREGHGIRLAHRGAEALALVRQEPFDLLIVDEMMPQMTGSTVIQSVRADSLRPDVPILGITAKGEPAARASLKQAGADRVVGKPFSPRELADAIAAMLDGGA